MTMRLQAGSPAPRFEVEDVWGNPIRLRDFAGQPVLLSFLRNAACAVCNLRVHQLIERYPAYQRAGLVIVAVFESPPARVHAQVGRQDVPFPLVGDPQAKLYDRYGVETSEAKVAATIARPEMQPIVEAAAALGFPLIREDDSNFSRIPADFLIGPDLVVARAHYAAYVTDHLPLEAVEAYLRMTPAVV
jgi:thioredoxin-dependent peroxiredoxin